jgi:hypothetical protein
LFRWAVLKLYYTSAGGIAITDVKRCFGKELLPKVIEADDRMDVLHKLATLQQVISKPGVEHIISSSEIRMVNYVLEKKSEANTKSLNEILASCILEIKNEVNVTLSTAYDKYLTDVAVSAKAKPKAKATAEPKPISFTDAGSDRTMVILQKACFSIGMLVYHKDSKDVKLKITIL